ncbi:hypothetical protein HDU67_010348 [Dinochytrium kinnereticum]|nr:hypothetical protein HDU67_010348 [Dinochytrium kinnereticum]
MIPCPMSPLNRLSEFAESLCPTEELASDMEFWIKVVAEHFAESGSMIYVLRHAEYDDSRSFELNTAILPRFFKVTFDSGVERIELILKGAKEYQVGVDKQTIIMCPGAALVYHFKSGEQVYCNGALRATFNSALKMDLFEFSTHKYTEMVTREAALWFARKDGLKRESDDMLKRDCGLQGASVIIEIVGHMRDLITQTLKGESGPIQCLQQIAANLTKTNSSTSNFDGDQPPSADSASSSSTATPVTTPILNDESKGKKRPNEETSRPASAGKKTIPNGAKKAKAGTLPKGKKGKTGATTSTD